MTIRTFSVTLTMEMAVEVDDAVIAEALDPSWKKVFYDFDTEEDVVKHLCVNLMGGGLGLSNLDGWANHENDEFCFVEDPDVVDSSIREEE